MPLSYGPANYPSQPTTTTFAGSYPGTQAVPGGTEFSGQALAPENNLYPGLATFAGQGLSPLLQVLYSLDDVSDSTPSWTYVDDDKVRSFGTSRGRESEDKDFDAGTASVVVDNRDRAFDPNVNASIRPMNRWWLREQFSGETNDLFKGYADSYDNQWPGWGGSDAECLVSCADEFKVLALDALPSTSPPRDTYQEVIASDNPNGYFNLYQAGSHLLAQGNPGPSLKRIAGASTDQPSPIVGDPDYASSALGLNTPGVFRTDTLNAGDPFDATGLAAFTVEGWFLIEADGTTGYWLLGPTQTSNVISPAQQYGIAYNKNVSFGTQAGRIVVWFITDEGGGAGIIMSQDIELSVARWYHVVFTSDGSNVRLYVNGVVRSGPVGFGSGTMAPMGGAAQSMQLGASGNTAATEYAEIAFYRYGLSASRIAAHYQAGTQRGLAQRGPAARVSDVLDAAGSTAPRMVTSYRGSTLQAQFYRNRAPIDPIRDAVAAGMDVNYSPTQITAGFFTGADGTLNFLGPDHRLDAPYDTSQVTIGDAGGTEVPHLDLNVDYSESFLTNEWNVTREGSQINTQTASDATSVARYFKRSQSKTGVILTTDSDALAMAQALVAKYKDPMQRVTGVNFNTVDPIVSEAVFKRELMDKITVKRTPPGGGSRISQSSFIQKIEVSGANDGKPWSVNWNVSPL
jgi:hypothetical protein